MNDTYRITATKKRDGRLITGTTEWDGLSSLYTVDTDEGDTAYVSVLDTVHQFERIDS